MDEARATFVEGERLFREVGDLHEIARLLCGRVHLAVAGGKLAEARALLAEIDSLGAELAVEPDGELGRTLAQARAAVESGGAAFGRES